MTSDAAQRNPGTHMTPQLATGAKAELPPIEVIREVLDGLKHPERFDWWKEHDA